MRSEHDEEVQLHVELLERHPEDGEEPISVFAVAVQQLVAGRLGVHVIDRADGLDAVGTRRHPATVPNAQTRRHCPFGWRHTFVTESRLPSRGSDPGS